MIQITRVVIVLVGLLMAVAGCYLVFVDAGVSFKDFGATLGPIDISVEALSGGIVFSFFGVILIFLAGKHFKRLEQVSMSSDVRDIERAQQSQLP